MVMDFCVARLFTRVTNFWRMHDSENVYYDQLNSCNLILIDFSIVAHKLAIMDCVYSSIVWTAAAIN